MRKRDLERFEKLLLETRRKIVEEMGLIKRDSMETTPRDASGELSSHTFHMADQGTDAMEREKAFMIASKNGRFLHHIDEALRRIQKGTYGRCVQCGVQINVERLKVVPHARLCIQCKSLEEETT
jgi:DnaK suppressor protein